MKTRDEQIKEFLNSLSIDMDIANYIYDFDDINSFEDISNELSNKGAFSEAGQVIYYSRAIDFLKENDPSLNESLEISNELGFNLNNLNSEVLASLLKERILMDEFSELENEIDEFFERLEEEAV